MGYINTRDPEGTKKEREERTKLAEARNAIKPPVEYKKIQEIQEQEKLKELEKFEYIDFDAGVGFGAGFNDNKTYHSEDQLKEALDEEKAINNTDYGLTDEELKAKAKEANIFYLFEEKEEKKN